MSKRRKVGNVDNLSLDVKEIDFDSVRKEMIDFVDERRWNMYIESEMFHTLLKDQVRFLPIHTDQSTFNSLDIDEKLKRFRECQPQRLHHCFKNIHADDTRGVFEKYISKREVSDEMVVKALVGCIYGENPDFMKRDFELENITTSNISQRLFLEMNGVTLPKEIIDLILGFIKFDKSTLFTIGMTCSSFYLSVLQNWKEVLVTKSNIFEISLLVLRNVRILSFKEDIGRTGIHHVFSNISKKLECLKLLFRSGKELYEFLKSVNKTSLGPFESITKLEFLPSGSRFEKNYKNSLGEYRDLQDIKYIPTLFPSLQYLVHPPYLMEWFCEKYGKRDLEKYEYKFKHDGLRKLRTKVKSLRRTDFEKDEKNVRTNRKKLVRRGFSWEEEPEFPSPSEVNIHEVFFFHNLTHLYIENLELDVDRKQRWNLNFSLPPPTTNFDKPEEETLSFLFNLLSKNLPSLKLLSFSIVAHCQGVYSPKLTIDKLGRLKSLEVFRIPKIRYSDLRLTRYDGQGGLKELVLPNFEDLSTRLGEFQVRNILHKPQNNTSLHTFVVTSIHQLRKLDLSLRLVDVPNFELETHQNIISLMMNTKENSLKKFQYRIYVPQRGYFFIRKTLSFCQLQGIGVPVYEKHSTNNPITRIQEISSRLLVFVVSKYFSPEGHNIIEVSRVELKVEKLFQGGILLENKVKKKLLDDNDNWKLESSKTSKLKKQYGKPEILINVYEKKRKF